MLIPTYLRDAIQELTQSFSSTKKRLEVSKQLSHVYKTDPNKAFKEDENSRLIYLLTRLPATYSVLSRVLRIFFSHCNHTISSLLDLGSGPATSVWAISENAFDIEKVICVEQDEKMLEIAKKLYAIISPNLQVEWNQISLASFEKPKEPPSVLLLSYVLNEISKEVSLEFFQKLEDFNSSYMIIIEPGTVDGYKRILALRNFAVKSGWSIIAPCPHLEECPLQNSSNWCHFYERVQRTKEHKMAKGGSLGYEDEKFSYLIIARNVKEFYKGYVLLSPPIVNSGFIELDVCAKSGSREKIKITRKDNEAYKNVKKLDWGDFYFPQG